MKEKKDNKHVIKEITYKEFVPNQETADAIEEVHNMIANKTPGFKTWKDCKKSLYED